MQWECVCASKQKCTVTMKLRSEFHQLVFVYTVTINASYICPFDNHDGEHFIQEPPSPSSLRTPARDRAQNGLLYDFIKSVGIAGSEDAAPIHNSTVEGASNKREGEHVACSYTSSSPLPGICIPPPPPSHDFHVH